MRAGGRYPSSRSTEPGLSSPSTRLAATIHPTTRTLLLYTKANFLHRAILAKMTSQLQNDSMRFGFYDKTFANHDSVIVADDLPLSFQGQVLTVGNFDGVHRGHTELLRQSCELADILNTKVTAITFDPHPLQLLDLARFQPPLTTIAERCYLLCRSGADQVLVLQTTSELLKMSAICFFEEIIMKRLRCTGLVEGFNFRFGHGRLGSLDLLRELCQSHALPFREVSEFQLDGQTVSSSSVRHAIVSGDLVRARELLGRSYRLEGRVGRGAARGRTLGYPTANLEDVPTVLPAPGVYAVLARTENRLWPAAANIGPNPTFDDNRMKIEVHLIGFQGELHGQKISVEFIEKIRDTMRFNSREELVQQLNHDVKICQKLIVSISGELKHGRNESPRTGGTGDSIAHRT